MKTKEIVLTTEGLKKLEDELEFLKSTRRREIAEKIKEARGFGDLSENSEYDDAKNEQAQVESRIIKIENMLKNAEVVDEDEVPTDIATLGNVVKVLDEDMDEEVEYHLVGSTETNPFENKISVESPIGKALMGKKIGERVKADVPDGELYFKILNIHRR